MSPWKSQILGMSLALATSIGCIAYERLVKTYSFGIIIILSLLFYIPALFACWCYEGKQITTDVVHLVTHKNFWFAAIAYSMTWITTPIWYIITKRQGVMVGSIYEVKYIVMLALIYIFIGENKMSINTYIGIGLALSSIWFISRA